MGMQTGIRLACLRPARVVGGVSEVLAEALEFVNASDYFTDNAALADVRVEVSL
jgi:hypothetical protein